MSSNEHPEPPAPAESWDPARMDAQTARLMANDMASLAGAMFRLLQPRAVAQPASAPEPEQSQQAVTPPVPGIVVPSLDLQPRTPTAPPAEAATSFAVPALAVPGLAVPGTPPFSEERAPADFDVDPEPEGEQEAAAYDVPELAAGPAGPDADDPEEISARSRALLNEIAFLDD